MVSTSDESDGPRCECKVGRVADTYDLGDLPDRLARDWETGDASLRTLADRFNRRVLERALRDAGRSPVEKEVGAIYEVLSGDEPSAGERTQLGRRLERDGVDVGALREAFVSHQTVHKHVKGCFDAQKPEPDSRGNEEAIFAMEARTEAVAESTLETLANRGDLALDGFDVTTSTRVACESCGRTYDVDELLRQGGCTCRLD
jgi:hypothetical protein